MATIAEGGLFPPQIDSYLPAINVNTLIAAQNPGLFINYNTSPYNNLQDIKSIHISITRQSNYHSTFSDDYIRGVYIINKTPSVEDDTLYIPTSVLNKQELSYNEYYKVQVRLSKIACPTTAEPGDQCLTGQDLSDYLMNESNLSNFSEWSTVCLIRFIAPPIINLDGNGEALSSLTDNSIDTSSLILSGNYVKSSSVLNSTFPNLKDGTQDKEYLSSYDIKIYNNVNDELLFESDLITINRDTLNSLYYEVPYFFNNSDNIKIALHITTANLYEEIINYNIIASYTRESWSNQSDVDEVTSIDTVIGKINITFMPQREEGQSEETVVPAGSILTVRRASDEDDFTIWKTIWKQTLSEDLSTSLSYDDFTIESGVLYKYEITYTDTNGDDYFIVEGPVISVFDHAFLTGEGTQLCVKFNPNISGYKRNVSDSIVTTIGGVYPYIGRNGDMNYRSFSLSGTIAYEMDLEHQFCSRSSIYGEWIDVYGSYLSNHYFNQQNDRLTQRKFREIVEDYLYSGIPKIFRSTPEGNILVQLTDINLTPKNELGRMIYDFTCTATEIGEASIENYKLYKIQDFGEA